MDLQSTVAIFRERHLDHVPQKSILAKIKKLGLAFFCEALVARQ